MCNLEHYIHVPRSYKSDNELDVHEAIVFLACPKGEVVKYKPKSSAMLHHPQVEVKQMVIALYLQMLMT
jgi:hypothetical protein